MDKVLAFFKPFLTKELAQAIVVHKSPDTLLDIYVPKSIMPVEYGGTAGKLTEMYKNTLDPVFANRQYFAEEEATKRVNEELRPGKPKTERDLFGYFCALFGSSKWKD